MAEREIITHYFHLGYPNEIIREFLSNYHDITMSLRTLKRRLRDFSLRRNGNMNEDVQERIREVIENEISNGSGASLGYRSMWHLLRLQYHVHVPRRVVAQILHEVDPEGVQQRRRRRLSRRRYISFGPNFCCHVDGQYLCAESILKNTTCRGWVLTLCDLSIYIYIYIYIKYVVVLKLVYSEKYLNIPNGNRTVSPDCDKLKPPYTRYA